MTLVVLGTPAPKGSMRAFLNRKTGRAQVAPGGSKVNASKIESWNVAVRDAALHAIGNRTSPMFVMCALDVGIVFGMARPRGHWGVSALKASAPAHPTSKPDIDKLARTTLDAMTGSIFDDDSRIVKLSLAKEYALPGHEGATIIVRAMA